MDNSIHTIRCKKTGEGLATKEGGGQCVCPSADECRMRPNAAAVEIQETIKHLREALKYVSGGGVPSCAMREAIETLSRLTTAQKFQPDPSLSAPVWPDDFDRPPKRTDDAPPVNYDIAMAERDLTGAWLQIGGAGFGEFGSQPIEVRVSGSPDGSRWSWRNVTEEEKAKIIALMSPPTIKGGGQLMFHVFERVKL